MGNKLSYERFDDIFHFMRTIEKRPDTGKFSGGSDEEEKGPRPWAGTNTYEEALEQLHNGLPEVTEEIKSNLNRFRAATNHQTGRQSRPRNYYYGHAPNVPAAIIGLPKSMRQVQRIPCKVKTVNILFSRACLYGVSAETMADAGKTVVNLVYMLEKSGYRVNLDILLSATDCGVNGDLFCSVNLKKYGQPLDLRKLSFPLVSPAMFRRFGFKWKETLPTVKRNNVNYGSSYPSDEIKAILGSNGVKVDNMYVFNYRECQECDYDAIKLAETLGIKI